LIVLEQIAIIIVDDDDRYIGGYKAPDGVWRWVGSGAPMTATFNKWQSGHPYAAGEYAQIETSGEWDDADYATDHFICEVV
jgi:hypothetical protein